MNLENLHPQKMMVTLAEMQAAIDSGKFLCQKKYDGMLSTVKIAGATIIAEFMRGEISGHFYTASDRRMFKRFPQGWYAAITVAEIDGENVLNRHTGWRQAALLGLEKHFTPDIILAEIETDAADCMAGGAEGVVAHAWGNPFGEMLCVKQASIYLCRVTRTGLTQSVGIERIIGGENLNVEQARQWLADHPQFQTQDAGNVKLGGGACDQVIAGQSFVRIEGLGLTDVGKIREPKKTREWLVKV